MGPYLGGMAKKRLIAVVWMVLAGAVLVGLPRPTFAAAPDARCIAAMAQAPTPEAILYINHADVRYDFTQGREDLYAIVRRHGSPDAAARMSGRRVHGLTHSSLGYYLKAGFALQGLPDGTWCLWPRNVMADLGYSDTVVYVARDYSAGSCAFEAVLSHEEEHVAINATVVDDHALRLRTALNHLARDGFPLVGTDPDRLREQAQEQLDAGFRDALMPLLADRTRRNADLDTEHSYRALNAQCDRW